MDSPTQPPATPTFKPMTLALAGAGLLLTVSLTLVFSRLIPEYRVWNVSVIGALALFAAARLGFWYGVVFTAVAIALKDLCLYLTTPWWEPYPLSWLYFGGYVLVGWVFLRRSASVARAVGCGFACGLAFYVVSNFVSWLEMALPYDRSLAGLLDSYIAAIPFYRGTVMGDTLFSAALFGGHLVLSRAYFPAERVGGAPQEACPQENHW